MLAAVGSYQAMLQRLSAFAGVQPVSPPVSSMPASSTPATWTPAIPVTVAPPTYSPLGQDTFVRTSGLPAYGYPAPIPRRPDNDPNSYFMTQYYHPVWNPQGPQGTTNCGPASLAMALKAFGIAAPGVIDPRNVEGFIDKTRLAMMGTTDDLQLSSDNDVLRGALASGAQAQKVHGLAAVERAIAEGKLVVLAGNPAAYGHRFSPDLLTSFNGGHFITVTHMVGDRVWINDPLSQVGSLEITRDELRRYMGHENWNVGVAVWA